MNEQDQKKTNFDRWKSGAEPESWVRKHIHGWSHDEWLELLASLHKQQYWPMDEAAIGQHIEMLRAKLKPTVPATSHTAVCDSTWAFTDQVSLLRYLQTTILPHVGRATDLEIQRFCEEVKSKGRPVEKDSLPTFSEAFPSIFKQIAASGFTVEKWKIRVEGRRVFISYAGARFGAQSLRDRDCFIFLIDNNNRVYLDVT